MYLIKIVQKGSNIYGPISVINIGVKVLSRNLANKIITSLSQLEGMGFLINNSVTSLETNYNNEI